MTAVNSTADVGFSPAYVAPGGGHRRAGQGEVMVESASEFYDRQEVREPEQRAAQMFTALPGLIRHAIDNAPGMAAHLVGFDAAAVTTPEALAELPVLRRSDVAHLQADDAPFGGLAATPVSRLARVYVAAGPTVIPEGVRTDYWRFARALFAAGFRTGDLIHNAFPYHLAPDGMMVEAGARALGCPVVPAGDGDLARHVEAVDRLQPVAFTGGAAFLGALMDAHSSVGRPRTSLRRALVTDVGLSPSLRGTLKERHGIDVFGCYATADLGLLAYESTPHEGLIVDEAVIVEIVRPGSGEPVDDGEVGEVVVTSFNPDYPLIRFATGDLSAFLPGLSACGRSNRRLRGRLGRVDEAATVAGRVIAPWDLAAILERHALDRGRIVVERANGVDRLRLIVEGGHGDGLADALAASVREVTRLAGEVEIVDPGSLANDGKVIDDRRG